MRDKFFIDTDIFVYSFDKNEPGKQEVAEYIIKQALKSSKGIVSNQVVQEFINVATRKFIKPLSFGDCRKYLSRVMEPLCEIYSDIELYGKSLDLMERLNYSFYDSLIIAAAQKAVCKIIYSEDMQDEQSIDSLKIVNPFKSIPVV